MLGTQAPWSTCLPAHPPVLPMLLPPLLMILILHSSACRAFLIQKPPLVCIPIPITSCALRFKISADMMRRCTAVLELLS